MAAEPWVVCDGAALRASGAPIPSGIGLVVAAVCALGPKCSRDAIVRNAGLAATTTDILLAAAVDTGLVARARFGRNFLYSPARSQP